MPKTSIVALNRSQQTTVFLFFIICLVAKLILEFLFKCVVNVICVGGQLKYNHSDLQNKITYLVIIFCLLCEKREMSDSSLKRVTDDDSNVVTLYFNLTKNY